MWQPFITLGRKGRHSEIRCLRTRMLIFEDYKKANADCSEQREMRHLLFYKLQKITPQTYTAHLRTYTFAAGRNEIPLYK